MVGTALVVVGLAVQAVGVVVAVAGLQQTKADLFPGRLLPPGRSWRWLRARPPVRWVFGPPEVRAYAQTALAGVTAHGVARVKVTRGQPADDADEAAWRAYVMTRLDDLGREIDEAEQRAGAAAPPVSRPETSRPRRRRVAARPDRVLRHELSELVVAGRGDEDLGGAVLRGGGRQPAAAKRHWRQRGR